MTTAERMLLSEIILRGMLYVGVKLAAVFKRRLLGRRHVQDNFCLILV